MTQQPELYSLPELQNRYKAWSRDGQQLAYRTIHKWRQSKGFPEPVIGYGLSWLRADVHRWEKEQGYDQILNPNPQTNG